MYCVFVPAVSTQKAIPEYLAWHTSLCMLNNGYNHTPLKIHMFVSILDVQDLSPAKRPSVIPR